MSCRCPRPAKALRQRRSMLGSRHTAKPSPIFLEGPKKVRRCAVQLAHLQLLKGPDRCICVCLSPLPPQSPHWPSAFPSCCMLPSRRPTLECWSSQRSRFRWSPSSVELSPSRSLSNSQAILLSQWLPRRLWSHLTGPTIGHCRSMRKGPPHVQADELQTSPMRVCRILPLRRAWSRAAIASNRSPPIRSRA